MSARTPDSHLTHDELGTPRELARDCHAVGANLRLERLEHAARAAVGTPPSLHFEDYPREVTKRGEIRISDAAARLAGALHLHLD